MVNHVMSKQEHNKLINQGQTFIDALTLCKNFTHLSRDINDYLLDNNNQRITFDFQELLMVEPMIQIEFTNDQFSCYIGHGLPDATHKNVEIRTGHINTLLHYLKLYFNQTIYEELNEYAE